MSNIFKTLANIDRRVWHLLTFILVGYTLLHPVGLPLKVSPEVKKAYEVIESLKPGDVVLINFDIAAFGWDEIKGSALSMIPHIFSREGVKVIFFTDQDQGYIFIERTIAEIGRPMSGYDKFPWYEIHGKKYLQDYINIGFIPGFDKAIAALAQDFRGTVGRNDWYGNNIEKWLDDNGIKSAKDIDLILTLDCAGAQSYWVSYWYIPYKTRILNAMIGVSAPGSIVNYNAGMLEGIVISIRGAAEYQYLSKYYGMALVSMDAFSIIQFMLIIAILIGNLGYYGWERRREKR